MGTKSLEVCWSMKYEEENYCLCWTEKKYEVWVRKLLCWTGKKHAVWVQKTIVLNWELGVQYAPWPCTLKCWLSAWLPDMDQPTGAHLDHHHGDDDHQDWLLLTLWKSKMLAVAVSSGI